MLVQLFKAKYGHVTKDTYGHVTTLWSSTYGHVTIYHVTVMWPVSLDSHCMGQPPWHCLGFCTVHGSPGTCVGGGAGSSSGASDTATLPCCPSEWATHTPRPQSDLERPTEHFCQCWYRKPPDTPPAGNEAHDKTDVPVFVL